MASKTPLLGAETGSINGVEMEIEADSRSRGGGRSASTSSLLALDAQPSYRDATEDADTAPMTGHQWDNAHPNQAHHKFSEKEKELMCSYESLDYDKVRSEMFMRRNQAQTARERSRLNFFEWATFGAIGATVGSVAFVVDKGVEWLSDLKFDTVKAVERDDLPGLFVAFAGTSLLYGLIASLLVAYVEPVAGGSGIPEIKGYLNGTNYQRFLVLKTGLVKVIGLLFSVSSGLCIGKEGPLIHTGAVVAAQLSSLPTMDRWYPGQPWVHRFRSDKSKRDFVSGGAAAGVAAAFGAPVGGILFALEEASSFWSVMLTWKTFFCSMASTFTLYAWLALADGANSFQGLVSYGDESGSDYRLWEMPLFMLLGVAGGLIGTTFCSINERICHWRREYLLVRPHLRVAEVLIIVFLTSCSAFWLPAVFSRCDDIPNPVGDVGDQYYQTYDCKPGQYNDMATLIFTTNEKAIKGFFHDTARISTPALLAYATNAFLMAVITYGIAVPSGLFVPCILVGSAYGRLLGEWSREWFGDEVDPGVYALIGATSMLGGVSRITITLTVIILETTNDIEYLLPIMITVLISKQVADLWTISLYDMHVELKCIPFVESAPPPEMENMDSERIMAQPIVGLRQRESPVEVLRVLRDSTHSGFPVVNPDTGKYVGLVLRNQLIVLLRNLGHLDALELENFTPSLSSKRLKHEDLRIPPDADEVDLTPFMNRAPISVQRECPVARVYTLFRSMGLRHLVVCDDEHKPLGMITRKTIMSSFTQDLF